jgi:hypothetical protein
MSEHLGMLRFTVVPVQSGEPHTVYEVLVKRAGERYRYRWVIDDGSGEEFSDKPIKFRSFRLILPTNSNRVGGVFD